MNVHTVTETQSGVFRVCLISGVLWFVGVEEEGGRGIPMIKDVKFSMAYREQTVKLFHKDNSALLATKGVVSHSSGSCISLH